MKATKKIVAALLVVMMIVALLPNAFADAYTITAPANGHTYTAYQIFTGTYSAEDNSLSDLKWGKNAIGHSTVEAVDDSIVTALNNKKQEGDSALLEYVKTIVDITGTGTKIASGASVSVPGGYYLIKDADDAAYEGKDDAVTLYILKVVSPVTISPKTGVPTVEKKVKDNNDTKGTETGWIDSADYDVGDTVPFQLTATLGDIANYTTYMIEFQDTMSKGLTFNDDAVIMMGTKNVTSYFTKTASSSADGTYITFKCDDVKKAGFEAATGSVITVNYTATLNSDAIMGSTGNPNEVQLAFSNNPNGDGKGLTPKDKVIVFTYQVVVNKVDENGEALQGAGFTLYKKYPAGTADADADGYKAVGAEQKGDALTTFTWERIDDGEYKLVETTTPKGYNTIAPITFEVSATHDEEADEPKLTRLDGGQMGSGTVSNGLITKDVENEKGSTLPSTGGMGTTVFYVIGSVLVLGAAVLLVSKKRMGTVE